MYNVYRGGGGNANKSNANKSNPNWTFSNFINVFPLFFFIKVTLKFNNNVPLVILCNIPTNFEADWTKNKTTTTKTFYKSKMFKHKEISLKGQN